MMLFLENVLNSDEIAQVRDALSACVWEDGRRTAGALARGVKSNLQAAREDEGAQACARSVSAALLRHGVFRAAALPRRISPVLFSRYTPGMGYGPHTDDALMGADADLFRADLAFTIFLSPADSYEGGELVVESAAGEQALKLEAGNAVLYPAGSIHRVESVRAGERWAAIGWVQSLVREAPQREVLFDLSTLSARLQAAGAANPEILLLEKSLAGLMRLWATI